PPSRSPLKAGPPSPLRVGGRCSPAPELRALAACREGPAAVSGEPPIPAALAGGADVGRDVQAPFPVLVADAEAQHLVDGDHVLVRARVSGQDAPSARVVARQLLQVR